MLIFEIVNDFVVGMRIEKAESEYFKLLNN